MPKHRAAAAELRIAVAWKRERESREHSFIIVNHQSCFQLNRNFAARCHLQEPKRELFFPMISIYECGLVVKRPSESEWASYCSAVLISYFLLVESASHKWGDTNTKELSSLTAFEERNTKSEARERERERIYKSILICISTFPFASKIAKRQRENSRNSFYGALWMRQLSILTIFYLTLVCCMQKSFYQFQYFEYETGL
jgi:hypothetical protein